MRRITLIALFLSCAAAREIAKPLPDRPGNIFVQGDQVAVPMPTTWPSKWKLLDYDGKEVSNGVAATENTAVLGKLPIDYYELKPAQGVGRITLGVVAPLVAPTPDDSPISIDVAMAWFYLTEPQQRAAANLCTLAGINWVRDRLIWSVVETAPGKLADHSIYDDTARIQTEAGLKVLQVNHAPPPWDSPARRNGFPDDLRNIYRFYREIAARWRGQVLAFEPWNEADIDPFGAQLGCEIASLQKAAYLGLKAGNPQIIACENVFAVDNTNILADFTDNEPWAYFDTYNLHHYVGLDKFPEVYAHHRAVSGGKPTWVSECNMPVKWSGDPKLQEPSDEDLRIQANRVAKIFAESIYEGSVNTFYFMLPHYVEGQTQFGVLHKDLTPRPAYLAVAAVGRLLAAAKPVGRWKPENPHAHGYLFRAKPDGRERFVLVAWRDAEMPPVKLDAAAESIFDHLGGKKAEFSLAGRPTFVVFKQDPNLPIEPPPQAGADRSAALDKPSFIVLQAILPRDHTAQPQSITRVPEKGITCYAYNFSPVRRIDVKLATERPPNWKAVCSPEALHLAPGDRVEFHLDISGDPADDFKLVRITAGDAVLSLRLTAKSAAASKS